MRRGVSLKMQAGVGMNRETIAKRIAEKAAEYLGSVPKDGLDAILLSGSAARGERGTAERPQDQDRRLTPGDPRIFCFLTAERKPYYK